MPRTITCTPGILRPGSDAFPGASAKRWSKRTRCRGGQARPGEAEEPDRERDQREHHADDHHRVEHAAAARGGTLGAHRAQPGRAVALGLAAREAAVEAIE